MEKTTKYLFEDFLKEWHGKDYHGTDDDMPDAFDAWLSEIDQEDLIRIAGIAMRESELRGYDKASKFAIEVIKSQNK